MTSLWPGGACEFCEFENEHGRIPHEKCVGWARSGFGFCGCALGLCKTRLETHVMWDWQEPSNQQGDS